MLIKRPLVVYPNPFHALDEHGRAACAVRLDPDPKISGNARLWIGAKLKLAPVQGGQFPMGDGRNDIYDRTFEFKLDAPTLIPDTQYHRDRLRHSELIPGDIFTAKRGSSHGVKLEAKPIAEALGVERDAAIARWRAEKGDGEDAEKAEIELVTVAEMLGKAEPTVTEEEAIASPAVVDVSPAPKAALVTLDAPADKTTKPGASRRSE